MEEMKRDGTRRGYSLIGVLGITLLAILILSLSTASTATAQSDLPVKTYAYISSGYRNNVSVIDTAVDTVIASENVGSNPIGIAVSPNGLNVYVANWGSNSVSVIDPATNT